MKFCQPATSHQDRHRECRQNHRSQFHLIFWVQLCLCFWLFGPLLPFSYAIFMLVFIFILYHAFIFIFFPSKCGLFLMLHAATFIAFPSQLFSSFLHPIFAFFISLAFISIIYQLFPFTSSIFQAFTFLFFHFQLFIFLVSISTPYLFSLSRV